MLVEDPKHANSLDLVGSTPCWLEYQLLRSLGAIAFDIVLEVPQARLRDVRNTCDVKSDLSMHMTTCIARLVECGRENRPAQTRRQRYTSTTPFRTTHL